MDIKRCIWKALITAVVGATLASVLDVGDAAAAATPQFWPGSIDCIYGDGSASSTEIASGLTYIYGSNGSMQYLTIRARAPWVVAASTTAGVDYQWFRWRARRYYGDGLSGWAWLGDWTPWYYIYASDQGWQAATFRDYGGSQLPGNPSYFNFSPFPRSGGATSYYVANEIAVYYPSSGWVASPTYDSQAGQSGNRNGVGFC